MMVELKTRVEELKMENEYQLRLKDMNYNEKIKELTEKFIQEMESLKTKNQVLKTDKDKEEAKHEEEIADLGDKHVKELQDLESANNQKLMSEYEKYQELQAKSQKIQEDYERQLTEMEESKEQALEELTEYYENKLQEKTAQLEQVRNAPRASRRTRLETHPPRDAPASQRTRLATHLPRNAPASRRIRNILSSARLPQQCVLVLPGLSVGDPPCPISDVYALFGIRPGGGSIHVPMARSCCIVGCIDVITVLPSFCNLMRGVDVCSTPGALLGATWSVRRATHWRHCATSYKKMLLALLHRR